MKVGKTITEKLNVRVKKLISELYVFNNLKITYKYFEEVFNTIEIGPVVQIGKLILTNLKSEENPGQNKL